jgi:dihydrofolate reductase
MIRSIVVAVARNGVIGRDNQLPWKLPKDLAYFKRVTTGHPVVMGRRTWESIGKALPGRHNIVVTHDPSLAVPGATVVTSLAAAWKAAAGADEVSIIGGTSIFRETLPIADRIHLTEVEADVEGDTFFPEFDRGEWIEHEVERHPADERHEYPFRIVLLTRRARRGGGRGRGAA